MRSWIWIPTTYIKSLAWEPLPLGFRGTTQIFKAHWQAILAESISSRFNGRPCFKKQNSREKLREAFRVNLYPLSRGMHSHMHIYAMIHVYWHTDKLSQFCFLLLWYKYFHKINLRKGFLGSQLKVSPLFQVKSSWQKFQRAKHSGQAVPRVPSFIHSG